MAKKNVEILDREKKEITELENTERCICEKIVVFHLQWGKKKKGSGWTEKKCIGVGRKCLFSIYNGKLLLNTRHKILISR